MALLSVEEALRRILDGVAPTPAETITIEQARGRVLAEPLQALVTQPPFDASAMDGYAVRAADLARLPAKLTVIGEAAAGHLFKGRVGPGQAVRIFTGAPVPEGADAIVIQEDAERDGDTVVVREGAARPATSAPRASTSARAIRCSRPAGGSARARSRSPPPWATAQVAVRRRPRVAILSTGDELVPPGSRPGPGQIIASNHLGIAALAEAAGAERRSSSASPATPARTSTRILPGRRRRHHRHQRRRFGGRSRSRRARAAGSRHGAGVLEDCHAPRQAADVRPLGAIARAGPARQPGLLPDLRRLFLVPLIRALLGQPAGPETPRQARLAVPLEANGPAPALHARRLAPGADGLPLVTPVRSQDSSLLRPWPRPTASSSAPPRAPRPRQAPWCPSFPSTSERPFLAYEHNSACGTSREHICS